MTRHERMKPIFDKSYHALVDVYEDLAPLGSFAADRAAQGNLINSVPSDPSMGPSMNVTYTLGLYRNLLLWIKWFFSSGEHALFCVLWIT